MIEFVEDKCSNYQHRTFLNIELSELTLAFAIDYTTAGEKCTLNYARICEKPIIQFTINENGRLDASNKEKIEEAIKFIKDNNITILNIAGNGIYTFNKYGISQDRVNELVTNVIEHLINRGCKIKKIRSGAQTGADEAGLIAGNTFSLETVGFCPKGWRFRDINNNDISSKEEFFKRFNTLDV